MSGRRFVLDFTTRKVAYEPIAECCGARLAQGPDDGGASETYCLDCGAPTCSVCAGWADVDGDEGRARLYAQCKDCAPRCGALVAKVNEREARCTLPKRHEGRGCEVLA